MEEDLKIEKINDVFSLKNFQNYRNSNDENQKDYIIKDEERPSVPNENCISIGGGDSAYYSGYSYLSSTPHSSILSSSQFSSNSASLLNLTKSSNFQQHSESIREYSNNNKKDEQLILTPVTQNAQRISAFHITTPKNNQEQSCYINKRSSNNLLEEFQNTPKRFKHCDYDIYSTPQKHKKRKTNFFQRLHSAPDIESTTKEDEIVLWKTPIQSTPNRTPLHTVQENTCTPIYLSLKRNSTTINENSVNELLNCSNDIFDSILNSDSRNSSKCRKSTSIKKLVQNNENYQPDSCLQHNNINSCKTFRRFLKFNSQNNTSATSKDDSKIEQQTISTTTLGVSSKRSYPAIHSVIHDRLKAKKRVNAERIANLNRQNSLEISQNDTISFDLESFPKNDFSINSENEKNSSVDTKPVDMVISPVESIIKTNKTGLISTQKKLEKSFNMEISLSTDLPIINLESNVQITDMDISFVSSNLELETSKDLKNKKNDSIIFEQESKSDIFLDDIIPLTPPPYNFENNCNNEYNNNLKYCNSNLEEKNIHKTPPRKSSRSSSTSSQKSSICVFDKEKFKILYPTIPETPKKYVATESPKKISPKKKKQATVKNKKHTDRTFYNGSTYLNIISKLEPYTIVLERIFYYLSDKDLLNLSMTTKVYRTIIQDNYKANLRLIKFIRDYKIRKENYCKQSQFNKNEKSDSLYKNRNTYSKIKPFSLHNEKYICKRNSDTELKQKVLTSPPVSPSKQKFYEYQKIIKNLSDQQIMAKCPRCTMASRIINQAPLDFYPELESINELNNEKYNNNNNINTKNCAIAKFKSNESNFEVESNSDHNLNKNLQQSCSTSEMQLRSISEIRRSSLIQQNTSQNLENKMKLTKAFSVDSWQGQLRKQRLLKEISIFQPYGECTSIRCKFKYCLECFCDYHPKKKCKLTASISPSKEDIQNGILQIIKSPKKTGSNSKSLNNNNSRSLNMKRKSLKRLCFN